MYQVIATHPTAGASNSLDSRKVGPFVTRRMAEEAATRLVDDPRRYAHICIVMEGDDPREEE